MGIVDLGDEVVDEFEVYEIFVFVGGFDVKFGDGVVFVRLVKSFFGFEWKGSLEFMFGIYWVGNMNGF